VLSQGKVTADEAERLIAALERAEEPARREAGQEPRYIRVLVDAQDAAEGPTKVNVRVPLQLLRAGVRLTGIIPAAARDQVNAALRKDGVPIDISNLMSRVASAAVGLSTALF
jgi:hypothetical protein